MAASTLQLSSSGTHKPWVYFPKGFEETLSTMSKYFGHHHSTTLFPKCPRVYEVLSPRDEEVNIKNYSENGNSIDKQLCNSLKNKVIDNSQDDEDASQSPSKMRKKLLSLGKIPKLLKCYACEREVKEDHFSEHLIFGSAKCEICDMSFMDCSGFQQWTTENLFVSDSCDHIFKYSSESVQYLLKNISQSHSDSLVSSEFVSYVNKLSSLQDRWPWKEAIETCKNHIKMKQTEMLTDTNVTPTTPIANWNGNDHGFSQRNGFDLTEHETAGCFLSQNYDLQQLEETTEFVEVHESGNKDLIDQKTKKKKKNASTHKRKGKQIESDIEDDESLEYLPVPSNGFYYVSIISIETCPNCYELICPSRFTVNIQTYLLTYLCSVCRLTIYFTSPEVQILTDDILKNESNSIKRKRGRPKKIHSEHNF